MLITEAIERLTEILKDQGDGLLLINDPHLDNYIDIKEISIGFSYSRNKFNCAIIDMEE